LVKSIGYYTYMPDLFTRPTKYILYGVNKEKRGPACINSGQVPTSRR